MAPRLNRLFGVLRVLVWLAIALLLALPALTWLEPGPFALPRANLARADLAADQRMVAWLIAMPPYLAVALGFGQLLGFCRRVRDGAVFTAAAALALRRLGWSLVLAAVLLPLSRGALGLAMPSLAMPGLAMPGPAVLLAVAVSATLGLVFVAFAAILGAATELAEENARFV